MTRVRPIQPWSKTKASIVLYSMEKNHQGEIRPFENSFFSIHDFTNYLRWCPDKGLMIGYKRKNAGKGHSTAVETVSLQVAVKYGTMQMENEVRFKDVYELADFFRKNRDVAQALQVLLK